MKKYRSIFFLAFITGACLVSFSFFNETGIISKYHADDIDEVLFTANPPLARTGAPGEGNCTACHAGSTQSAVGTVDYLFSEPSNVYYPDQTYSITLSVPSGPKNGFELTILDGLNEVAGTFSAGTNTSIGSSGGRNYIRHSASTGITSWTFDWTAPDSDLGNLTVFYAFVKANNAGGNSGDEIFLGQETISIAGDVGTTDYELLENSFEVFANADAKKLNLQYETLKSSNVNLNLLDLSGKLVYQENFGQVGQGKQKAEIDYSRISKSGVYFVSLLIDNYAINKKVYLH